MADKTTGLPPLQPTESREMVQSPSLGEILALEEREDVVAHLSALLEGETDSIEIEAGEAVLDVSRVALLAGFIGEARKAGKKIRLLPEGSEERWPWSLFQWKGE